MSSSSATAAFLLPAFCGKHNSANVVGMVIGRQGSNINKVKSIPGVMGAQVLPAAPNTFVNIKKKRRKKTEMK